MAAKNKSDTWINDVPGGRRAPPLSERLSPQRWEASATSNNNWIRNCRQTGPLSQPPNNFKAGYNNSNNTHSMQCDCKPWDFSRGQNFCNFHNMTMQLDCDALLSRCHALSRSASISLSVLRSVCRMLLFLTAGFWQWMVCCTAIFSTRPLPRCCVMLPCSPRLAGEVLFCLLWTKQHGCTTASIIYLYSRGAAWTGFLCIIHTVYLFRLGVAVAVNPV